MFEPDSICLEQVDNHFDSLVAGPGQIAAISESAMRSGELGGDYRDGFIGKWHGDILSVVVGSPTVAKAGGATSASGGGAK